MRLYHHRGYVVAEEVIKMGSIEHNEPVVRREALEHYRMLGGSHDILPRTEEERQVTGAIPWPPQPLTRAQVRRAFDKVR